MFLKISFITILIGLLLCLITPNEPSLIRNIAICMVLFGLIAIILYFYIKYTKPNQ